MIEPKRSPVSNRGLLVVDDEPLIRDVLRDLFIGEGYTVHAAADLTEAEAALSRGRIAVALIDLKLPESSGIHMLDRIKQYDPAVSVILMTGYPTIESVIESLQHGACNYIIKPFRLHDLRGIVRQAQSAFDRECRCDFYRHRVEHLEQTLKEHGVASPEWVEQASVSR